MSMTSDSGPNTTATNARARLESAGRLHSAHWLIVLFSLGLTIFAWRYSANEHDKRVELRFEQQANQAVELVADRMRRYEDALWGGTALISTLGGDVTFPQWKRYAESIQIEGKYPGINGIGVIHAVSSDKLASYLEVQRRLRPDYHIHPAHSGDEYYPITYIIPVGGNEKAVGLDMAHETNRFTAAKKARDTGLAQITGPITLVQDAKKTPGFLFYAPFYSVETGPGVEERRENFLGMVYAPFVVQKLMEGVLSKERRQVGIRIADGDEVLHDENVPTEEFYDPRPMFTRAVDIPLYGRVWSMEIRSAITFRTSQESSQPSQILVAGIVIDLMIVGLFLFLRRTARGALYYADKMTIELEQRTLELEGLNEDLERSNRELDEFAHIASHDLKEPLRGIYNYSTFLLEDYEDKLDDDGKAKLNTLLNLAKRLGSFIDDLLRFSRVGREDLDLAPCDLKGLVDEIVDTLSPWLESEGVVVEIAEDLPRVRCHSVYMTQVFQNLITNGVKYNDQREKKISVGWKCGGDGQPIFSVADNGIGIPEKHQENIFRIFKRLHGRDVYGGGTGAGLTLAKKILERHNGQIWLESVVGEGTTFYVTWNAEKGLNNEN